MANAPNAIGALQTGAGGISGAISSVAASAVLILWSAAVYSILLTSNGAALLLVQSPHLLSSAHAQPAPAAAQVNDVKLGDLYLQVLSTQDLVGYDASLPYIRKGDIQWQAIHHVFTVENEVDHFKFLMKVQHSVVVYNISAELSPDSTAINPSLYFHTTPTPTLSGPAPAPAPPPPPPSHKTALTPLTGNLGYNQENKTRKVDIVALCDVKEQTVHNATLIVKINFQFRLLSSSTNTQLPLVSSSVGVGAGARPSLQPLQAIQPTVPITVYRNKKCYVSNEMGGGGGDYKLGGGNPRSNRTSTLGSNPGGAGNGGGGAVAAWGIFASTSSSSIFFVSIGISLGVIVIICIVVAFYHITTFRPQQRKNKCYSELPFTDPRAAVGGVVGGTGSGPGGQGHVPMFMPKSSSHNNKNSGTAMQMVNNPSHMQRGAMGMGFGVGVGALDSNTLFMLNQSKISDGSDQSQTQRVANQSPVNSLYQQHPPVQQPPQSSSSTPFLSTCTPSAVYNSYSGQACCYPAGGKQQGPGGNTSTPVDMRGSLYNQRDLNTTASVAVDSAAVSANGGNSSSQQQSQSAHPPQDIVINRDMVSFQNIIQEGTFGKLCHGFVTLQKRGDSNQLDQQQTGLSPPPPPPPTMEVFIKTVSLTSSVGQVELMLAEGFKYRNTSNKYILSLAAVVPPTFTTPPPPPASSCASGGYQQQLTAPPMLIYPYSANGNLKIFLKNLRESHQPLTTRDVVGMALQIGKAVQYLDKRKVAVGDLATRNCVVDERLCVKITDSALARDIFPNDYNCLGDERNRPVKWLSPESLAFYLTEPPGDIWSFGVTIWELLSLAQQPYLETDPFEMLAFLKKGSRLYQPLNCPDELYRLMESCWCYDSEERPKINKLITYLVDFNKTLGAYI